MNYDKLKELPFLVRVLCFTYEGYIVGGAVKYLTDQGPNPKDWDVVIPPEKWPEVCKIVPAGTVTNSWGGFKLDGVDFWSQDLGQYFRSLTKNIEGHVAVHPKTGTTIQLQTPKENLSSS